MSMCPVEEVRLREAEGGLNVFEATEETARLPFRERVADPARTVKKYRRSAAGRDMRRWVGLNRTFVITKHISGYLASRTLTDHTFSAVN